MEHYDEYYEQSDSEKREFEKERQSKCRHVVWNILRVSKEGKVLKTICRDCSLVNVCK